MIWILLFSVLGEFLFELRAFGFSEMVKVKAIVLGYYRVDLKDFLLYEGELMLLLLLLWRLLGVWFIDVLLFFEVLLDFPVIFSGEVSQPW